MDQVKKLREAGKNKEAANLLRSLPPTLQSCSEWAILAYYTGDADPFYVTVAELTACSPDQHNLAVKNAIWYAAPLSVEQTITLTPRNIKPHYFPANPSIIAASPGLTDGGYLVTVRTVNYRQRFSRVCEIPPEFGGVLMSTNYLLRLSSDFAVAAESEIADPQRVRASTGRRMRGMEDLRLYRTTDEKLRASFTLLNTTAHDVNAIRIGRVDISCDGSTSEVTEIPSPSGALCEKNWLPFCFKGSNAFYYSSSPPTVVDENGVVIYQAVPLFNLDAFKGSAAPLPYKGGHLLVIHEWVNIPEGRKYFHRFVWFSPDFALLDVSRPFIFDHAGVEFCSGSAFYGKGIVLAYGSEDFEARLALVTWDTIESMWLHFADRLGTYLKQGSV